MRLTAALAVVALIWAGGIAQYPESLSGAMLEEVAAAQDLLVVNLVVIIIAGLLAIPSLWWLYASFQRGEESLLHTGLRTGHWYTAIDDCTGLRALPASPRSNQRTAILITAALTMAATRVLSHRRIRPASIQNTSAGTAQQSEGAR